jgi:hypothetical protein
VDCFYHSGSAAVGTCKSCGKGVCRACAVDLGQGLACRDRCETDVAALIAVLDRTIKNSSRNERLIGHNYRNRYAGAIFYILFGALSLGFSIYQSTRDTFRSPDYFLFGVGFLFFGYGLYLFVRILRVPKNTKRPARAR